MCHRSSHGGPDDMAMAGGPKVLIVTEHDGTVLSLQTSSAKALPLRAHASKMKRVAYNIRFETSSQDRVGLGVEANAVLMLGHWPGPPAAANNDDRRGATTVFILDSGASIHVTGDFALFCSLRTVAPGGVVRTANGHSLAVVGCGSIVFEGFRLRDVLFVPGLTKNLVSVSKLTELDYAVEFVGNRCLIRDTRPTRPGAADHGAVVGKGRRTDAGLYELDFLEIPLDR